MRGQIALLLLVTYVLAVDATDQFTFDVSFTCGYHQRESFKYNVQFFERDYWWFNGNDKLTDQRIGVARPGFATFTMFGEQDGDEQFSKGYDVFMRIFHDCTEYQTEAEVELDITPKCLIGKGRCHFTISKDIKDMEGPRYHIAKLVYE